MYNFKELEIIRNKDDFQTTFLFVKDILENYYPFNYPEHRDNFLLIQKKIKILDSKLSLYEKEFLYLKDNDLNNPKSHIDIIRNDLNLLELYKNNPDKFEDENSHRKMLLDSEIHKNEIQYNLLPISMTKNEMDYLINNFPDIKWDSFIGYFANETLLETVNNYEHQINSLPPEDELKKQVIQQARELQKNYDDNYVDSLNKIINEFRNMLIEKNYIHPNPDNNEVAYFFRTPQLKYYIRDKKLGMKKNGGGYKEKVFKVFFDKNKQKYVWEETIDYPKDVITENYDSNKVESKYIKNFHGYCVRTNPDTNSNEVFKEITKNDLQDEDKQKLDKLDKQHQHLHYCREEKFGIGCREQIEGMCGSNIPNLHGMLCGMRKCSNDMRNHLINNKDMFLKK